MALLVSNPKPKTLNVQGCRGPNPKPQTLNPTPRFRSSSCPWRVREGIGRDLEWGVGSGVSGLGFRVWGFGFRVQGLGFGV